MEISIYGKSGRPRTKLEKQVDFAKIITGASHDASGHTRVSLQVRAIDIDGADLREASPRISLSEDETRDLIRKLHGHLAWIQDQQEKRGQR